MQGSTHWCEGVGGLKAASVVLLGFDWQMKSKLACSLIPEQHPVFFWDRINWFTSKQTQILLVYLQVWITLGPGMQQESEEQRWPYL